MVIVCKVIDKRIYCGRSKQYNTLFIKLYVQYNGGDEFLLRIQQYHLVVILGNIRIAPLRDDVKELVNRFYWFFETNCSKESVRGGLPITNFVHF